MLFVFFSSFLDMDTNGTFDQWSIGTEYKPAIWGYYIFFNYFGVFLCGTLMFSVFRNPRKTSVDILIGALCSGCLWMSLTCGSQCLANLVHNYFYGGDIACKLEAFFHVSAILVQFFSVAAISIRSYLGNQHIANLLRQNTHLFVCTQRWFVSMS